MKDTEFQTMPLEELWRLHQRVIQALDRKLDSERIRLQDQLDELGRRFARPPKDVPRRPCPKVLQKNRNPENAAETWSGRGKIPRWLAILVASGRRREEFQIP
jgi:DNA-binding protein H-NS